MASEHMHDPCRRQYILQLFSKTITDHGNNLIKNYKCNHFLHFYNTNQTGDYGRDLCCVYITWALRDVNKYFVAGFSMSSL